MALCPFAKQLPLGWSAPPITPTAVCLHSAVTPPGYNLQAQWLAGGPNSVACHFYVRGDGTVEQYLDTAVKANAQYEGNDHCISIESEGLDPDHTPWNADELLAIERLLNWCHTTHGIPLVRCTSPFGPGVGWHSMWTPPGTWNHDGHTCPGAARIAQIPSILAPAPTPQEAVDMPLASVTNPSGEAEVFWTDAAGHVLHSWQSQPGAGPWVSPRTLDGIAGATGLTATIDGKGVLNVVAVTAFGLLATYKKADGTFAPWAKFPS